MKLHHARDNVYVTEDGGVYQKLPVHENGHGGYSSVHINRKTVRLHTLMLEAFHGERPAGAICRHLDGNPNNNHPSNLAWGTQAENIADCKKHGTWNPTRKLTPDQVREIIKRRKAGEMGKDLAAEFGVSEQRICDVFKGRYVNE